MRRILTPLIIICLLCLAVVARADIAVIVHPDNPVPSMTQQEVSNLYLGRTRSFGVDGHNPASIYEQPADSSLREVFYRALNGMDIKQLDAYWARLRFSGEVLPPAPLPDSRSVVDAVSRRRNAIGYVDATTVSSSVKVVLRLKE